MEGLLAVLIACFYVGIAPIVFAFSIRAFRVFLEYLENTPRYPSLDVAIAEIAFLVREGRLSVEDITQHLFGFSEGQINKALSILYETQYLTVLDVEFQEIEEQMLFCQALASSISLVSSRLNNLD